VEIELVRMAGLQRLDKKMVECNLLQKRSRGGDGLGSGGVVHAALQKKCGWGGRMNASFTNDIKSFD
jgi:hypothetical protein